jgi:hypothetical protein
METARLCHLESVKFQGLVPLIRSLVYLAAFRNSTQ